jgi:hypothetical protein
MGIQNYLINGVFKNKKYVLMIFIGIMFIYYFFLLESLIWFPVPLTLKLLIKRFVWASFFCSGFISSLIGYFEKYKKTRILLFLFSSLIMIISSFWYSFILLPLTFIGINFLLFYLVFIYKVQNAKSLYT